MRTQLLLVVASLTFAQLHPLLTVAASSALSYSVACVVSFVVGGQLLKSLVFLVTILPSVVLLAVTMLPFF